MAPERQTHYTLNFPKSSTPSSTTSSNKSGCSSSALELSIVGLPAPRSRASINNNATKKPRVLKSAPIKNAIRTKAVDDKRVDRPWTTSKRKIVQNTWSLESNNPTLCVNPSSVSKERVKLPPQSVPSSRSSKRSLCSSSSATISLCSVSASSAGDVSSLEDAGDSNSQYSQALSEPKDPPRRISKDKFSFPVAARTLMTKLETAFEEDDESSEDEEQSRARSPIQSAMEKLKLSENVQSNACQYLTDVQEKVLTLVENQQACSRQTWLVMQRLSATLDTLTKNSHLSEQKSLLFASHADAPLPHPLLLKEAAGCALRLADILAQIGSSSAAPLIKKMPDPVKSVAPPKRFPACPADLQSQKEKLRPVPVNLEPSGQGLMEELNAALRTRRVSIYQSDQEDESVAASEEWRE